MNPRIAKILGGHGPMAGEPGEAIELAKTAAVLCPGSSLVETYDPVARYDLRIGVNRVVSRFACDYWAALDDRTFDMVPEVVGRPVWICDRGVYHKTCETRPRAKELSNFPVEEMAARLPNRDLRWHTWSFTAALVAAHLLGAHTVDVFGCDWRGECDWDGYHDMLQRRSPDRWARERAIFEQVRDALEKRGTRVTRITGRP